MYVSIETESLDDLYLAKSRVELCVRDIGTWMLQSRLKLNQDKSEVHVFTSKFGVAPELDSVAVVDELKTLERRSRNLGVVLDKILLLINNNNNNNNDNYNNDCQNIDLPVSKDISFLFIYRIFLSHLLYRAL